MERTMSDVLRKIVRKYSSKSPEVIVIAVESPTGVIADEINGKLSERSHVSMGISSLRKVADDNGDQHGKQEEEEGASHALLGSILKEQGLKGSLAIQQEEQIEKSDMESIELDSELTKSEVKSSKPVKRKWEPEEIKQLIKLRRELNSRFQVLKGRTALWEKISSLLLLDHGINRSPGQCKYLWASLVQKYEEIINDKESQESWPYFDDVNDILSDLETTVPS